MSKKVTLKQLLIMVIGLLGMTINVQAQNTEATASSVGQFSVHEFNGYKLHIYLTEDQMGDASYIIEGIDSLVTLEQPLFKINAAAFDKYLAALNKPVSKRISDFHLGNTGDAPIIMPEGMPAVVKGPQYSGMMAHFAEQYGDAIEPIPTGMTEEVPFNSTVIFAGVPFIFLPGASNDFPGANILIGKEVVYTHFTPAKSHTNTLYISTIEGLESRLNELERILKTGAYLIVGGHGNPATVDDVKFLIGYLNKLKELYASSSNAETFASALIAAYPNLPGQEGVKELAKQLYPAK